jgi:hypothetical protein
MNNGFDLPSVLTELLYGDEAAEPLEQTLSRLLVPGFVLRIDGQIYDQSGFTAHVRELRRMTIGGGKLQVLEQISTDNRIAGRYLFLMTSAEGQRLSIEAHLFATVNDGKLARIIEVARQVGNDAEENFLADT